ncbi:hypothetical protein Bca4012_050649 [Brassica carinata]
MREHVNLASVRQVESGDWLALREESFGFLTGLLQEVVFSLTVNKYLLKEGFEDAIQCISVFCSRESSSVVWCFVGFEGSKLWVHHWFHNRVSDLVDGISWIFGFSNTVAFASVYVDCSVRAYESRLCQNMVGNVPIFGVFQSQSFAHQTRDCSSNGEVWGYGFLMTCSKISKHVFSSNMKWRESRTRKDVRCFLVELNRNSLERKAARLWKLT